MTNSHMSGQGTHVAGAKHIPYHPQPFVHMKTVTLRGNNTGSILATVLQH